MTPNYMLATNMCVYVSKIGSAIIGILPRLGLWPPLMDLYLRVFSPAVDGAWVGRRVCLRSPSQWLAYKGRPPALPGRPVKFDK